MKFQIENMTCGGCARGGTPGPQPPPPAPLRRGATPAIQTLDPAAEVEADTVARRIEVRTTADPKAVEAAIAGAGFTPVAI